MIGSARAINKSPKSNARREKEEEEEEAENGSLIGVYRQLR